MSVLESILRSGIAAGGPAALFGGGLAVLIGVGELARRSRTGLHVLISVLFFVLGAIQILHGLYYGGLLVSLPFLFWWDQPLVYMLGPLAYWTVKRALDSETWSPRALLHLVPVPLVIAVLMPYYLEPAAAKTVLFQKGRVLAGAPLDTPLLFAVYEGAVASLVIYLVLIIRRLMVLRGAVLDRVDRRLTLIFVTGVMLLVIFGALGRLIDERFMAFSSIEITLMLCVLYVVARRHPEYPARLQEAYQGARYRKSRLSGMSLEPLRARLEHLMEGEYIYRREDLSLADVAHSLEITPHQLSEFLNHRLEKSFNNLVNEYRVAEARRLLGREPRRTVLSIAYEVGFNNRASFNAAFLKFTGKTPVEYRREAAREDIAAS